MHPLQRRSLFAILAIAESAIQQMRSILAAGDLAEDVPLPQRTREAVQPQNRDYLSEKEEAELERDMEEARLRMVAEEEARLNQIWGQS